MPDDKSEQMPEQKSEPSPSEAIVNHLRSIMNGGDWEFHGPGIKAIVSQNVNRAIVMYARDQAIKPANGAAGIKHPKKKRNS